MERTNRLPIAFAVLHLLIGLTHAVTHRVLHIFGSPAQLAYVTLVIYAAPVVALVLMLRGARAGSGLLCAALAGSFVYGLYFHFIGSTADHVGHLPNVPGALAFRVSAVALALCDGLGALVLALARVAETVLEPNQRHVILVDGECVFCNRLVSAVLRFDRQGTFHFSHLQSEYARSVVAKHGGDPSDVDPVYLLANAGTPQEVLLVDGAAGREIWPRMLAAAALIRLLPVALLNVGYAGFARVRYRLVGRYDACYVPTAEQRARYLA